MSWNGRADDTPGWEAVAQLRRGSGVLIGPRTVLTAAHCVANRGNASVRFQTPDGWTPWCSGTVRVHPGFCLDLLPDGRVVPPPRDHVRADLAVVTLDATTDEDLAGVTAIPLGHPGTECVVGTRVALAGYGVADGTGLAHQRYRADNRVAALDAEHLGLLAEGDTGVMTAGDSGGPLLVTDRAGGWRVVGIASVFAERQWSLYTRVVTYRGWILGDARHGV